MAGGQMMYADINPSESALKTLVCVSFRFLGSSKDIGDSLQIDVAMQGLRIDVANVGLDNVL